MVNITVSKTIPPCSACSTTISQVIGANTIFNIDCTGCSSICNITVLVTQIGGTGVTPGAKDWVNANQPITPAVTGCTGGNADITYTSAGNEFKIRP